MNAALAARRTRVAEALDLGDALLLVGTGEPVPLPEGTDQTYPFRSHAEYFYLAAQECPGGVMAFDPREGARDGWVSFVPDITEGERIWEGRPQPAGHSISTLEPWLAQRRERAIAALGAPLRGVRADDALTARIRSAFAHARRPKDADELAVLRASLQKFSERFRQSGPAAEQYISHGESARNASLDVADLAAHTAVASIILNMDEAISKD